MNTFPSSAKTVVSVFWDVVLGNASQLAMTAKVPLAKPPALRTGPNPDPRPSLVRRKTEPPEGLRAPQRSGRILMSRNQTSSPWSCKRIGVANFVPHFASFLNLLCAFAASISAEPRS